MELATVKQWLKVDFDDDDTLITMIQRAAEQYVINAVGRYDDNDQLMRLAVLALCGTYYKDRTCTISVNDKRNDIVRSMIVQLQQDEYGGDDE